MKKRVLRTAAIILQDIALTAVFLCVFALFHHVIPFARAAQNVQQPVAVVERPAETAAEEEEKALTAWQEKFSEHFSEETVISENSYRSAEVSVTVTTYTDTLRGSPQAWHVADIYISDIENFACYAPEGCFTSPCKAPADELAAESGAVLCINGDFCNTQGNSGMYARNGELFSDKVSSSDICVLYYDGTMETLPGWSYDPEEIIAKSPYQIWKFGPRLLDDEGKPLKDFNIPEEIESYNPRSAIGYYEPGHYCFVIADGRQAGWARGLMMDQLAEIFSELGCTAAYNLDGGASAVMLLNGSVCSRPSAYREIGDILLIRERGETK